MATKKSSPSLLVSGLAMGMGFLQALIDEVVALGGFDEQIHYLSTEHGRETVKQIAALIVKSEWRVPRSLMEQFSEDYSKKECSHQGPESWASDRRWRWIYALEAMNIPYLAFGGIYRDQEGPIPQEILDQILNKPLSYPALITYQDEEYIICNVCTDFTHTGRPLFTGDQTNEEMHIVKTKYFDLTR